VYDSLGPDFFLALAPGWLNLGLWEGPGDPGEAPVAVKRLVETLARELPTGAVILDAGNGLGRPDVVIAQVARPHLLVALNVTESQLRAGRPALRRAGAHAVVGDAARIPLATGSIDGLISVEAAFHFSSRAAFFAEAYRVLRPDGVLALSDVSAERLPRRPAELLAGATLLRFWGLRRSAAMSSDDICRAAAAAGFGEIRLSRCGDRVFDPAIALLRRRLDEDPAAPRLQRTGARLMLRQWALLRRRQVMDYVLLSARRPG
jgi:SAM-dependent methyltransferase